MHTVLVGSAVAVADKYAADAAEEIFREGGNAVDAAVAVAFSLAVTYPEAGNIGGGGFMTLYMHGKPYFLDYRERAPRKASRDMYLDSSGKLIKSASLVGNRAVGVPGTVRGMWQAQRRFGNLQWKQTLAPAIRYARNGFIADSRLAERRDAAQKQFAGRTDFEDYFANVKAGAIFQQPELASTLARIAADGPQGFYAGRTASLIVAAMKPDGLISARDLHSYRAVWRAPLISSWNGYEVITAPPPSAGGIGLIQLLKMKSDLMNAYNGLPLNSARYIHLNAEIEKRVFADRSDLGDPDFVAVPVASFLTTVTFAHA
jgi:gamma-glutamyltranspeptidase/glutathione hydrolase